MNILDKLEKPNLVIVDEWKERSEHFGQIRYDTFGHVALEDNEIKELIMQEVDPYDLPHLLDTFLDASMHIRDNSLMFSAEVVPELLGATYFNAPSNKLYITYKWKEI